MKLLMRVLERLRGKKSYRKWEEKFDTARRLRDMGMSDNDIHRATNMSFDDIRML